MKKDYIMIRVSSEFKKILDDNTKKYSKNDKKITMSEYIRKLILDDCSDEQKRIIAEEEFGF